MGNYFLSFYASFPARGKLAGIRQIQNPDHLGVFNLDMIKRGKLFRVFMLAVELGGGIRKNRLNRPEVVLSLICFQVS